MNEQDLVDPEGAEEPDDMLAFPEEAGLAGTPSGLLNLVRVAPEALVLPLLFVAAAASRALTYPDAYILGCLLAAAWAGLLPGNLRSVQPLHVIWKAFLLLGLASLLFRSVVERVSARAVAVGSSGELELLDLMPWWVWMACGLLVLAGLSGVLLRVRLVTWIALAPSRHIRGWSLGILVLVAAVAWAHHLAVAADAALRAG